MKKNVYLWIFLLVSIVLCGFLFVIAKNVSNKEYKDSFVNMAPNASIKSEVDKKGIVPQEEVDLTQSEIDFEEDADDLSDDFVDDSSFDGQPELDSIENDVY